MNSRGVSAKNLVNFSADINTLNSLEEKDSLLSFPFDHIYACHSENTDRRQTLHLDKEVEISTCLVGEDKEIVLGTSSEINRLSAKVVATQDQNKRLKDLLIYHLDLIQQQNDHITKREKLYQALKQENEMLKSKLSRIDRRIAVQQRHSLNTQYLNHVPPTVVKTEPDSQLVFNSYSQLVLPDNRSDTYLYNRDNDKSKILRQNSFEFNRTPKADLRNYLAGGIGSRILDNNVDCEDYTMIENKRSVFRKEIKTENSSEPLYTVTSNSGNPVIQRLQRSRRRSSLSSVNRTPKTSSSKNISLDDKMTQQEKFYSRTYSVNKKSKIINTYSKSRSSINNQLEFTGSLSDRLQLMDTTPTGDDPYQLGEADMREQSPIPKLMLHKTNHGRVKICTETDNPPQIENGNKNKKNNRFSLTDNYGSEVKIESKKTLIVNEPDMDIVKTEPEIDWRIYDTPKTANETSLCDFSYGENSNNIASHILPTFDTMTFHDLFGTGSSINLANFNSVDYNSVQASKNCGVKTKSPRVRTSSLIGQNEGSQGSTDSKRSQSEENKLGCRKRALSTTGLTKNKLNAQKNKPKLVKGKALCRGKKLPLPGLTTSEPYHTLVGDPDLSWYFGLDPDVKSDDVEPTGECRESTVEVPRWREKPYTSFYSLEGTENLDDKVFEKRHQKLEAEERRQLRWHMRRVREQRHVERLKQRHRDSRSGGNSPAYQAPQMYTTWPQPQRDVRFIEITDTLPVTAFGEILPALPESDFKLPWVRTSKALKRSKRSRTLH